MKRSLAGLSLAAMLLGGGGALAAEKTVTLAVDNMYCELCPGIVKKSLAKVEGVSQVAVSFEKKTATVTYDDGKTTVAALTAATNQAGYPSRLTP
jgi:periplasmic mercuric ion binding protein